MKIRLLDESELPSASMLARSVPEGPEGEVASKETYSGVLGADIAGYQVVSQRMPCPGPFSEHEITIGRDDEVIRVTVSDFTTSVCLDGVFLAADKVGTAEKGTLFRKLAEVL